MTRHICLLVAHSLIFIGFAKAQTIQDKQSFEFIDGTTDSTSTKFIKSYKCNGKKGEDLVDLYNTIKQLAVAKGANCFRFRDFTRDSIGKMSLTLDTYLADQEFLRSNIENHTKNTVFLFSDDQFNNKRYAYKLDKDKHLLKSGSYIKYKIKAGSKVKVNSGGFTGTAITVSWKQNSHSTYYSLSGFGLLSNSLGIRPGYNGSVGLGVSFTTGKLTKLDTNFGLLLTQILEEQLY